MGTPKNKCPIPFEQQPFNEYFALKTSWFFHWSTLDTSHYIIKIIYIFSLCFIFFIPLVISIMPSNLLFWKIIVLDIIVVNFVFILIFIRLYLGWSYIIKRLISATVFYEESGWYDGQIWIKSIENLTKDRLIGLYEIEPLIKRIKYSLSLSLINVMILYALFITLI